MNNIKNELLCRVLKEEFCEMQELDKAKKNAINYVNAHYLNIIKKIEELKSVIINDYNYLNDLLEKTNEEIKELSDGIDRLQNSFMVKIRQNSRTSNPNNKKLLEEHKKIIKDHKTNIKKLSNKKDNITQCIAKCSENIHSKALELKLDDTIENILVKCNLQILELNTKKVKSIELETKQVEKDYEKVNQYKNIIKKTINEDSSSINLTKEDLEIMGNTGREGDPFIFIAHGSLTGTQFYLKNNNISVYTLTQPGTTLYADPFDTTNELIRKTKLLDDQSYPNIIKNMETEIIKISEESAKIRRHDGEDDIFFPVKGRIGMSVAKKHFKSSDKKYIMNDMIIKFRDPVRNTYIYNLIKEAKTRTFFSSSSFDFELENLNSYKPPNFLSLDKTIPKFLLSDLINFYGERPYVLFNCRTKHISQSDYNPDYVTQMINRQNKRTLYMQPILARQTSNLDDISSYSTDSTDDEHEPHKFLKKYMKYKLKYLNLKNSK